MHQIFFLLETFPNCPCLNPPDSSCPGTALLLLLLSGTLFLSVLFWNLASISLGLLGGVFSCIWDKDQQLNLCWGL